MRNKVLKRGLAIILLFAILIGRMNILDADAIENEIEVESIREEQSGDSIVPGEGTEEDSDESAALEESNTEDDQTDKTITDIEALEESEESENSEEEKSEQIEDDLVTYDLQPTSMEEVKTAIALYEEEYSMVLEAQGLLAALEVLKPHWEFKVAEALMPEGYNCQLVDWDENFEAEYYTFFPNPAPKTLISTNPNKFKNVGYKQTPPSGAGINISELFGFVGYTGVDVDYPNVAVVADDTTYKYGAMWAKEKLNLALPFKTDMYLYLSHCTGKTGTTNLGDGMTLTLHNDPRGVQAIGSDGEGLGVYGSKYYENYAGSSNPVSVISNALTIEFDLYQNSYINSGTADHYMQDPTTPSTYGHCALLYPPSPLSSVRILPEAHINNFTFSKVETWYPFEVEWEPVVSTGGILGGKLTYSFNGVSKSIEIGDVTKVFSSTEVYWGFTGSTGGYSSGLAAAVTKLPTQGFEATKSVTDKNDTDIDGGIAKVGDTLHYTIEVEAKDTVTGIGPVKLTDTLSAYVEYIGHTDSKVLVTTQKVTSLIPDQSFYVMPVFTSQSDGTIIMTVESNHTLTDEGDKMWFTFDVIVKENSEGKTVYNTAYLEADKLSEAQTTNTTEVNIITPSKKTVAEGSSGENASTVYVGNEITYKINYINNYGKTADLTITDNLPEGLEFVKATDENGDLVTGYTSESCSIVWEIQEIADAAEGFVTITAKVTEKAGEMVANKAKLEWTFSDGSDPIIEEPETTNPVAATGNLEATKVDSIDGSALNGAQFYLYYTGTDGVKYYYSLDSITGDVQWMAAETSVPEGAAILTTKGEDSEGNVEGKLRVEGLPYNTYTLEEMNPPPGYQLSSRSAITFTLDQDNRLIERTIENVPMGKVTVTKVNDAEGEEIEKLPGAEFYLFYIEDSKTFVYAGSETIGSANTVKWTEMATATPTVPGKPIDAGSIPNTASKLITDSNGELTVEGLYSRIYYLQEVTPPAGYALPADMVTAIVIAEDDTDIEISIRNSKADYLDFSFTKTNEDGTAVLSGADFTLYKWNDDQKEPDGTELVTADNASWTKYGEQQVTSANGLAAFKDLEAGIYQLVEHAAPTGYETPAGQWRIVIVYDNGTYKIDTISMIAGADGVVPQSIAPGALSIPDSEKYTLANMARPSFSFTKVAAEDEDVTLRDAEFKLYIWKGLGTVLEVVEDATIASGDWVLVEKQTSNSLGKVTFANLEKNAVYQLVETKAPSGYSRPVGQWRIIVVDNVVSSPKAKGSVVPPAFYTGSEGGLALPNMKDKVFPFTGFGGTANYLVIGLSIMAISTLIVFFLFSKRRKIDIKDLVFEKGWREGEK